MAEALLKAIADQEHHLEFSVKLALLQSFFSIGVIKCVYSPDLIRNPRAGEIIFENIDGEPILDPQTLQPTPLTDESGEPVVEPDQIMNDEIYLQGS